MNRFLSIPLVIVGVVFGSAWYAQTSSGSRAAAALGMKLHSKSPSRERPMSYEEAEAKLLEDWPTLSGYEAFSRVMPSQSYYVAIDPATDAETQSDNSSFLFTLYITADSELFSHSLHVDRYTGVARVLVQDRWLPYEAWREETQAKYEHLLETDAEFQKRQDSKLSSV